MIKRIRDSVTRVGIQLFLLNTVILASCAVGKSDETQLRETQRTAVDDVNRRADELKAVNKAIWEFAEVGLQEVQSSALLVEKLRSAGFEVTEGVSNMPTAFVASYGTGKPIIGLLAEYDALPGMSQKVSPNREPVEPAGNGHACGHSGLGTGALGAVLAAKAAMEKHNLPGTIRLYGTPAEETLIGKVYMALDGQFDDLDVCLHWHPATTNEAWASSSKAMVSAKFTFDGTPAHASVSPESGRSALDAVELMNIGVNFMREHIKEDARLHYVITDGGGAPNVVPPTATVWYFCRANDHRDVEYNFRWLKDIAGAAATMTRTELAVRIDTDCHEAISNDVLSDLITRNLTTIGPPQYTDEEEIFARRLQEPLIEQFGTLITTAIDRRIHRSTSASPPGKGSVDVGDISWRVPTSGLRTVCFPHKSPGHSWQNVASMGSSIGDKGILYAAKSLAVTVIDLLEDERLISTAHAEWEQRMKERKYFSFIPEGQKPPTKIR